MADDDRPPLDSFVVKPKRPPLTEFVKTAGKTTQKDAMGVGERVLTGMADPLVGGKQLLTHVTGTPQEQQQVDKSVQEREAGIQAREGGGLARGVGAAITGAPLLAAGPLGGAIGAAAGGAAAGALQPTTGKDYWTDKTQDALFGAAFGLSGGLGGKVIGGAISPALRPEAQALSEKGVNLTPGQMAGGIARRAEEAFKSLPILGSFIRKAEERTTESFNKAVLNQALEPIGAKLDPMVGAGHDAIMDARNKLGAAYDNLLPNLQLRLDRKLVDDISNVKFLATELPESYQKQFDSILTNRLGGFFVTKSPVAGRQGPTLKDTESAIRSIADTFRSSPDPAARQMAMRLDDVRGAMRDALARQNPNSADLLNKIDQGYAMFARAQGAASRRATSEGVFTPNDLLQTIKAQDKTARKGAFAQGDALLQPFAEYGQTVLSPKVPNSGTVDRALWSAAIAAAVADPIKAGVTGAGLGVASLPYTRPGIGALNALARSPGPVRQGVGSVVRRGAPYAAIAGEPSAQQEYGGPQQ